MPRGLTVEEFIEKARTKHGDKYDYSEVEYKNFQTKVAIICPAHGRFFQTPASHIHYGRKCPKCAKKSQKSLLKLPLSDFVARAKKLHDDKYDYSLVSYENVQDSVVIICPTHGKFRQQASGHLRGWGCQKCGGTAKMSTDDFIGKARQVHGNQYDYGETVYDGANKRVVITCQEHGNFEQLARQHLAGRGCPACSNSHAEVAVSKWLQDNEYRYEQEATFPDCIRIKPLPFDFKVFIDESFVLIEIDGDQHRRPVFGEQAYDQTVRNDAIKDSYCAERGIKLFRLVYTDRRPRKQRISYVIRQLKDCINVR